MTEEPIYQYIKGQGWVAGGITIYPSKYNGQVTIELRKPEPGELCCWDFEKHHDLKTWSEWIAYSKPFLYKTLEHDLNRADARWAVFIPTDPQYKDVGV